MAAVCTVTGLNGLLFKPSNSVAVAIWQSNRVGHMRIWGFECLTDGNRWQAILRLSEENMGHSIRWLCSAQRRAFKKAVRVCVHFVRAHVMHTLGIIYTGREWRSAPHVPGVVDCLAPFFRISVQLTKSYLAPPVPCISYNEKVL